MINLKTCFHFWVFVYQMRKVADTLHLSIDYRNITVLHALDWILFLWIISVSKVTERLSDKNPSSPGLIWALHVRSPNTPHVMETHSISSISIYQVNIISLAWVQKYFQWLAASDCKEGPVKPNLTRGRRYDGIMGGSHDSAAWELLYWQTQRQFMLSGKRSL